MSSLTVGLLLLLLLGALVYLWLTVQRLTRAVESLEQRVARAALPRSAPSPSAPVVAAEIGADIVAAIAAAVAVTIRRPHHIVAIHPDANVQHAWSAEGRREIYRSHRIR